MARIVLIDNRDSFVYNLVDAAGATGHELIVYRNTVDVPTVLAAAPDLIILSPGPSHPRDAGTMMELVDAALGRIPILGICLGFQALLDHFGGAVVPCGPEHGTSVPMRLTDAGTRHPVFAGLAVDSDPTDPSTPGRAVPVARYHSLGCNETPEGLVALATTPTLIGDVVMAAHTPDNMALGLQFHPESILTPAGPTMLLRCIDGLLHAQTASSER
ncbi:glutamine amidotransferase-related protein [Corynebacterium uterequi]|uniref:anthranilate synthase n=1 Tax=Corynebacterium uterequi TaxID=1072256 RepID=A0A0G3HJR9_9CORY|nr:gamma-glutamyl-gamma-aminobutyrate hydrolase family protein [Corynebacterium uterequi]AKK12168.1 anthranilate/para-aminobenzoate synthase component II [Corynebacterium uterequi]